MNIERADYITNVKPSYYSEIFSAESAYPSSVIGDYYSGIRPAMLVR